MAEQPKECTGPFSDARNCPVHDPRKTAEQDTLIARLDEAPIELSAEQEQAAKEWAADDRLWTTQETVEFNLRVFARVIVREARAALVALTSQRDEARRAATELLEAVGVAKAALVVQKGEIAEAHRCWAEVNEIVGHQQAQIDLAEAKLREAEARMVDTTIAALKNVGVNVECGACMEIAFTGVTTNPHDCKPARAATDKALASLEQEMRELVQSSRDVSGISENRVWEWADTIRALQVGEGE